MGVQLPASMFSRLLPLLAARSNKIKIQRHPLLPQNCEKMFINPPLIVLHAGM